MKSRLFSILLFTSMIASLVSMAMPGNSVSAEGPTGQVFYITTDAKLVLNPDSTPGTTSWDVYSGELILGTYPVYAESTVNYPAGNWTGFITVNGNFEGSITFRIGRADPLLMPIQAYFGEQTVTYSSPTSIINFSIPTSDFEINSPYGQLILQVSAMSNRLDFYAGGTNSFVAAPAGSPIYPIGVTPILYTLTMAKVGNGTTTPQTGEHQYADGEIADITADPDDGWQFTGWTGDVANASSPTTTVTMNGNKTVTANFDLIPPEGGVSWWGFDENTGTVAYDAWGTNNGSLTGGPTWVEGKSGSALNFTNGNYVAIPDSSSLDITQQITVSAWVKRSSAAEGWGTIVSKPWTSDVSPYHIYRLSQNGDTIRKPYFSFYLSTGYKAVQGTTGITDGTWMHIAATYDGSNLKIYVNGILEGTTPATGTINTNDQPLIIGRNLLNTWNDWGGVIDEVKIYNRALTSNEVRVEAGLVPAYTLIAGVAPADGGTITRNPDQTSYDTGSTVTITANPADGYNFVNWTGDVSAIADVNSPTATIVMDSDKTITANFVGTSYKLTMAKVGNGTISPVAGEHWYAIDEVVNITATPDDGWHFIGWTGDVANTTSSTTNVTMNANKTVTATFKPIPPAGGVSWWRFDENTGTAASDSWGTNNGTLVGGPTWVEGKSGGALNFTNGNYVLISDSSSLDISQQITISAWIKRAAGADGWGTIVSKSWVSDVSPYHLYRLSQNGETPRKPTLTLSLSTGYKAVQGTTGITDGTWMHFVGTYDGSNLKIYVNGILEGTTLATGTINTNNQPVTIGHNIFQNYNDWFGIIDEVKIYNRAITENEVRIEAGLPPLYTLTAGVAPDGSGTVAKNPDQAPYEGGTTVTITANPADGYNFVNWTGDVSTIDDANAPTTTIVMDSNKTVTANFELAPKPDFTIPSILSQWVDEEAGIYNVQFTIINNSLAPAPASVARFSVDGVLNDAVIDVPALEATGGSNSAVFTTANITLMDDSDTVIVYADYDDTVDEDDESNNTHSIEVTPSQGWIPKADLVVNEIHAEWVDPMAGTYRIHFSITNISPENAPASFAKVNVDGVDVDTVGITALNAGGAFSGWNSVDITMNGSSDTIILTADATHLIDEQFENNNTQSFIWNAVMGPPTGPNLVVVEKHETWDDPNAQQSTYKVYFNVVNMSTWAAGAFKIGYSIDGVDQEEKISVPGLNPSANYAGHFTAALTVSGDYDTIVVTADVDSEVAEQFENDNTMTNIWNAKAQPGQLPASNTTVVSDNNPSVFGQDVTFTATVTGTDSTPTGSIQFKDGTTDLGSPVTLVSGTATLTISILTAGTHDITAVYSGDTSFAGSVSDVLSQVVNTAPANIPGDANGDEIVDAADITAIERIIAGLDTQTAGADANQDGKVNALDITKAERILAKLD